MMLQSKRGESDKCVHEEGFASSGWLFTPLGSFSNPSRELQWHSWLGLTLDSRLAKEKMVWLNKDWPLKSSGGSQFNQARY